MWLNLKDSDLKIIRVNTENTSKVMTSCKTLSWIKVKDPPFCRYPNLFAGTWKQYSKKAKPQLIRITWNNPNVEKFFHSLNFKWPYQASVIKRFEHKSNNMVIHGFIRQKKFFLQRKKPCQLQARLLFFLNSRRPYRVAILYATLLYVTVPVWLGEAWILCMIPATCGLAIEVPLRVAYPPFL